MAPDCTTLLFHVYLLFSTDFNALKFDIYQPSFQIKYPFKYHLLYKLFPINRALSQLKYFYDKYWLNIQIARTALRLMPSNSITVFES